MYIAMNRFKVKKDSEQAFENVSDSPMIISIKCPAFVQFHLLKGPEAEDHTLYSTHTTWQSKAAFEAWTKSDQFRASHARGEQ